jgi:hypothetical protein
MSGRIFFWQHHISLSFFFSSSILASILCAGIDIGPVLYLSLWCIQPLGLCRIKLDYASSGF